MNHKSRFFLAGALKSTHVTLPVLYIYLTLTCQLLGGNYVRTEGSIGQ